MTRMANHRPRCVRLILGLTLAITFASVTAIPTPELAQRSAAKRTSDVGSVLDATPYTYELHNDRRDIQSGRDVHDSTPTRTSTLIPTSTPTPTATHTNKSSSSRNPHPLPTQVLDESMVPYAWTPHPRTFIGTHWFESALMFGILVAGIAVVWWISLCQCCFSNNCFWNLWDEDCCGYIGHYRRRRDAERREKRKAEREDAKMRYEARQTRVPV